MTATPRLYKDDVKDKAKEADAYLCSMDDEAIYGKEIYRIGFGKAVEKNLLSDYKVLVLTVSNGDIPAAFQSAIANSNGEVQADDISKLIGCINALSKRTLLDRELVAKSDPGLMRKAVAFCQNIKTSKRIMETFNAQKQAYYDALTHDERREVVMIEADHVDGSMGAAERGRKLDWLNTVPPDANGRHECHILTNVRCLSEGVDVPSLDAVIFLSSRNSQVDVVQSVGRVMRRAPNKRYGYIIIPVIIPENMSPEEALDNSDAFAVVWTVLNALRAHDDRFNAEINKIDLNKNRPDRILVNTIPGLAGPAGGGEDGEPGANALSAAELAQQRRLVQQEFAFKFQSLQSIIYARMVKKVGTRRYWELWAKDVAAIAEKHIERIKRLIAQDDSPHRDTFRAFVDTLRKDLNPSVSEGEAAEMLAQHVITQPVFEALFQNYSFVRNNPVSVAMQKMYDLLHEATPRAEMETMAKFYSSVRERCSGIDNAEGRQRVIIELYDKFFKTAFPKVAEKLGIVYTPVECVDFIIHSVEDVLQKEFGRSISDENVHVLDPFTGTGTFITRLLQSGIIRPKDLRRKYEREIHANELVLLAYYIASINIENVYHDVAGQTDYALFGGICLTDTFQLAESNAADETNEFDAMRSQPRNSERIRRQKKAPIRIIIGNPPYSVGQKSANDNAQNQSYPTLERHIAEKYAAGSKATNKNSLYDSYIKAFRWATDRLEEAERQEKGNAGGIIAFISNAGWLDGNAMDGFRKCLQKEFTNIYCLSLRGNQRTSGELARKEGGKIFGSGSRTPIAITILVRKPNHAGNAEIRYEAVEDYLSREEKLAFVKERKSILSPQMKLSSIAPNEVGDWINQRDGLFETFIPLGDKTDKGGKTVFAPCYSCGVKTNRDSWVYNFSRDALERNMSSMADFYNKNVEALQLARKENPDIPADKAIQFHSTKISWSRGLRSDCAKGKVHQFKPECIRIATYRPFMRQHYYFDPPFNDMLYQIPKLFPTPQSGNKLICVSGVGVTKDFSCIMVDRIPDLELIGKSQCFPLYWYEKADRDQPGLFDGGRDEYRRHSGVSDFILKRAREQYGPKTSAEDVFHYVYGILHSEDYRRRFANDLKKTLARVPLVDGVQDFRAFAKAGRRLAELHLNYETGPLCDSLIVTGDAAKLRVVKMRFPSKDDKGTILYNDSIKIENVPMAAYEYVVNGKSAVEWLMERYAVTKNPDSGIVNDPNEWSDNPRYVLDLLSRVIHMSVETQKIVAALPKLDFVAT